MKAAKYILWFGLIGNILYLLFQTMSRGDSLNSTLENTDLKVYLMWFVIGAFFYALNIGSGKYIKGK